VDRLFLDANVLFSAAFREDAPLQGLWRMGGVELVTSSYAAMEAERHLDAARRARLAELMKGVRLVPDAPKHNLPKDVVLRGKDVPILAAAIGCRATHLITGDRRDFGSYFGKKLGGVRILPPRSYFDRMGRGSRKR
jgi:predicted nucleic acid-binding protein